MGLLRDGVGLDLLSVVAISQNDFPASNIPSFIHSCILHALCPRSFPAVSKEKLFIPIAAYTDAYMFIPGLESVSHRGNEIGICSMLLPRQVGIEYMEIMNCMVRVQGKIVASVHPTHQLTPSHAAGHGNTWCYSLIQRLNHQGLAWSFSASAGIQNESGHDTL
jgi:hypothetical protein